MFRSLKISRNPQLSLLGSLALAVLSSLPAVAQPAADPALDEPLVSDRPDFTESAVTVPVGHFQLELGATVSRRDGAPGAPDNEAIEAGEVLLRLGLAERLELRLAPGSHLDSSQGNRDGGGPDGRTDGSVGVKVAFYDGVSGLLPATALLLSAALPTGERELRAAEVDPELELLLAWDLTERLSLASNLGVASVSSGGERHTLKIASLSLGLALGERLGAFVEAYGLFPAAPGERNTSYADGGFTFALTPNHQLDVRVGRELRGDEPETYAGIGYAVRW